MPEPCVLLLTSRPALAEALRAVIGNIPDVALRVTGTALAALEAVRAGGIRLVLIDSRAPGLDGVHLGRILKSDSFPWLNSIPVVLLVEGDLSGLVGMCLASGRFDGELALPIVPTELATWLGSAKSAQTRILRRGFRGRALLVEDDADVREVWAHLLAGSGFEVLTAVDGAQADRHLSGVRPHLVIVDYKLPGGEDGLSVARRVRAALPAVGLVIVTGYGSEELAMEMLRAGVDDYVRKPVDPAAFLAVCDGALQRGMLRAIADRLLAHEQEMVAAHDRAVLAERLAALGELALAVRHEVNNALTALKGNLELLERYLPALLPGARAPFGSAVQATEKIAQITRRLVDLNGSTVEYLAGQRMTDLWGEGVAAGSGPAGAAGAAEGSAAAAGDDPGARPRPADTPR